MNFCRSQLCKGRTPHKDQQGFVLLLALVFVALFGGILATITTLERSKARLRETRVAAWEAIQIAKAARLYVRNQYAADPVNIRAASATPSAIYINTLINAGYLPSGFGRLNAAGKYVNALNQPIFVVRANWTQNGLGGDINNPETVPSAFVLFGTNVKASPDMAIHVVEHMREMGASITAPQVDRNGINYSSVCRSSGAAVSLWDTGCMTSAEFQSLANAAGLTPTSYVAGQLVIPAWKVDQPDVRAVMRYPQPENPGFATMLTDLGMGAPNVVGCPNTADQVSITTLDASGNQVTTYTGLCKVIDDTATANNRYHIMQVANLAAQRLIAEGQAVDQGGESAHIGTAQSDVMRIDGDLHLDSNLHIYGTRALAGIPYRLSVPNASLRIERNAYVYSLNNSRIGLATTQNATAENLITDTINSTIYNSLANGTSTGAPVMNILSSETISGVTRVTGHADAEIITENVIAPNARVTTIDAAGTNVQVSDTLDMGGSTMRVLSNEPYNAGAGESYGAIVGNIDNADNVTVDSSLRFLSSTGSLSVNATRAADNSGKMPNISADNSGSAECLEGPNVADACPNRQYFPPTVTP